MPPGLYPYLIFLHVCGVIGLFVALGLEANAVFRLGNTWSVTVVRENLSILAFLEKSLPGAAVVVLVSGVCLVLFRWGWAQAWIDCAFAVLVILAVVGPLVTGRRVSRIRVAIASRQDAGEEVPPPVALLLRDPVLLGYAPIPAVMGLAVVALMVFKPDWTGCLGVLCAALVVGLAAGGLAVRYRHAPPPNGEGATRAVRA